MSDIIKGNTNQLVAIIKVLLKLTKTKQMALNYLGAHSDYDFFHERGYNHTLNM